jgi:hypothetical protein
MLRVMTAEVAVTVRTVEPMPTAVVAAATTWARFPAMWGPILDKVWGFLRGGAPAGLYRHGHNVMLYLDDVPNVEVGVQVTGPAPQSAFRKRRTRGAPCGAPRVRG